ncbi:glycosyltransferase, putative [Perkinsus marinus ATCC 50983]|uniref:Mannosyltransferase n=1 Tax=Perkinsus marinus (strain ATCC 50983 / TXsc) TaxID=423536 RepID=C5KYS2_PERM5|nr:glycosyltransferase, putative [Perkinsus marinus ATCC 50983]EER10350.1 glycosyltransferase, putative [Perkinsus marinus ATCC 50983]|eukprot:XP_002778555.1 glycosyltransferase, putative [Perkinsus marinus ATCC 50983]
MVVIGYLDSILLYGGSIRGAFTWLNFAEFNFINDFGKLYGDDHSWLWYFIFGIPLLLLNHIVPLLQSLWKGTYHLPSGNKHFTLSLLISCLVSLLVLSLATHKELRFIMPMVPVLCLVVAPAVGPIRGGMRVALVAMRWHQYGPDRVMASLSREATPGDSAYVESKTKGYDWLVVWGGAVRREDNGLAKWLREDGDYDLVPLREEEQGLLLGSKQARKDDGARHPDS